MARALQARIAGRWRSFRDAFRGIGALIRSEENARLHALATIAVLSLSAAVGLDRHEWLAIILSIGFVWALEAMNTALEVLCDVVSPEQHPEIGLAKDLAAGAVLIAAMTAVAVAASIFGPRLLAAIRA